MRENGKMRVRDARLMLAESHVETTGPMTWADLGCGDGTFTRALAGLLAPGSVIHAMDVDASALRSLAHDGEVRIDTHVGDFTKQPWPFGPLDGILMANSLHYVREQMSFIRACTPRMTARRRFLIVEYDTDSANPWVPYPLSRARLAEVFVAAGYASVTVLGTRASVYRRANMYAALIEP
jgi:trans-aconitate methyltransferase